MTQSNYIHIDWIFEKLFEGLIQKHDTLYILPFKQITNLTFENDIVHKIIYDTTQIDIPTLKTYLSSESFKQKIVYNASCSKVHTAILMGDIQSLIKLLEMGYIINRKALVLMVINNQIEIFMMVLNKFPKISLAPDLLMMAAENNCEEIYFELRNRGLKPNISVYNGAASGSSLKIMNDINENIGISDKIVSTAIQSNNTQIIRFVITQAMADTIRIDPNLITYPILNGNIEIIEILEKNKLFKWHIELYYSAILSASMTIINYVEEKLQCANINVHQNWSLDTSRSTQRGHKTLLLDDMIYKRNNKKYFSHTMNYAIQSNSLDIVKYIHSKGYGITVSNFITAIQQSDCDILNYLITNYNRILPSYIIYYFSLESIITNKFEKLHLLVTSNLLNLQQNNDNLVSYRKESVHSDLIKQRTEIDIAQCTDPDYLLKYKIFFPSTPGYKFNTKLFVKVRYGLIHQIDNLLNIVDPTLCHAVDGQLLTNILFLFGTTHQINQIYPHLTKYIPSIPVLMEIICYGDILKLCWILQKGIIDKQNINNFLPLLYLLDNDKLNIIFENYLRDYHMEMNILLNAKPSINIVKKWIRENGNDITHSSTRTLLKIDRYDILELFNWSNISQVELSDLLMWCEEQELFESAFFLKNS